jgi:hypothetical protein
MRTTVATIFLLLCCASLAAQETGPQPYHDVEAYAVFASMLPQEEPYGFSKPKSAIVIRQETVKGDEGDDPRKCLSLAVRWRFREAISDYIQKNRQQWILQPAFPLSKPYKVVDRASIEKIFKQLGVGKGWNEFYSRYPGSGGYHIFSAVGFNAKRTQAVFYSGGSCGGLCGSWQLHVFEKVDGSWKPVEDAVSCFKQS